MRTSNVKQVLRILGSIVLLSGCATGALRVESQPEGAEVMVSINGQPPRKLGVTPYTASSSSLDNRNEPFQISIVKEGYLTQNVVVPSSIFQSQTSVQVKLQEVSSNRENFSQQLQKVAATVAEVQSMIRAKQYAEAERRLTAVIAENPGVATLHEMLGTTQYLNRDITKALTSFRKAASLNPHNPDTRRMIEKIQTLRMPAGGEQ